MAPFKFFRLQEWLTQGAILGLDSGQSTEKKLLLGIGAPTRSSEPFSEGVSFYAPDFFLTDSQPWLRFPTVLEISSTELIQALQEALEDALPEISWEPASSAQFEVPFFDLQNRFSENELIKAVPVIFDQARCKPQPERLAQWLLHALRYATSGIPVQIYGAWGFPGATGTEEGILGVTPELLFEMQPSGKILTAALAGTRRKSDEARWGSLLDDPKERREHQLVIDGIVEAFQRLGEVTVHPTTVVKLPGLSHLKTPIDLQPSRPVTFQEIAQALHPTPALGAVPRPSGWKWLQEQNRISPVDRARFGAPFGALWAGQPGNATRGLSVVSIRNVQWRDDSLFLGVGCGVIAESRFEREWLELQGKARAVRGILGL